MSDKVYTSSFTGPQIDEAVDKVINGDIEGSHIKEGSIPFKALANLTSSEKPQARENILAQEKLVSGVNVATINGESILSGSDIRIYETIDLSYIINSRPVSVSEPVIVEISYGSDYNNIYRFDFYKIFIKTVNEITLSRSCGNEIHFSYAGRTFPTYDYDHVIVYYNAPNYLLVCEAFSDQYNGVYNTLIG